MEFDFSQITAKLENVLTTTNQSELIAATALIAKSDVITRTLGGMSVDGNALVDYTPRYKAKKERAGKYAGHVTIWWDGALLESMILRSADDGAEIWFPEDQVPIARGNQEVNKRFFFGVNEATAERVQRDLPVLFAHILHEQR